MRKYENTYGLKNKRMNSNTYSLRRKVIDIIYEFKKYANLPRIEVRITDQGKGKSKNILGVGTMDNRTIIWISEHTLVQDDILRHVVAHEIGHAVYKLKHNSRCPIMAAKLTKPATIEQIIAWLKKNS